VGDSERVPPNAKSNSVDQSQRSELSSGVFHRSHGSFELVFSPIIFALLGLWLDSRLGTTPLLCVLFAVLAYGAVAAKIYYTYRDGMARHRVERADRRTDADAPLGEQLA
jgi:F0F1-type ATP synthase assembly protein I